AGARDVLECLQLDVEQVGRSPMEMALVRSAVELQVHLVDTGRASRRCEVIILSKSDSVRDDADPVETDALRIPHGVEEVRCNGWLAAGKQNVHIARRLDVT